MTNTSTAEPISADIFFIDDRPESPPESVRQTSTRTWVNNAPKTFMDEIAVEFETFLDEWHSSPEVYDNPLDSWVHTIYAKSLARPPILPPRDIPYFSPSSSSACRRELYEKIRGAAKDARTSSPHQGRWTRLGTAIGDIIQRDILFAEKHMEPTPRFIFERNPDGTPMFEDFAKRTHIVEHKGVKFALFGTCDGIMIYVSPDGEVIRIGLEIKSKQGTYAKTSEYSMRNGPQPSHVAQCTAYGIMYDVDYYIILYVNGSKKSWNMSPQEYAKNRDIKAFGIQITPDMKSALLDDFADVVIAAEQGNPPLLDIEKWQFNSYKTACALSLSDTEFNNLVAYNDAIQRSSAAGYVKSEINDAISFITEVRSHHK